MNGGDKLKSIAQTSGSDKTGGFIEVDIGIRFKNCIKPVDSEIFKAEWILVTHNGK